MDFLSDIEINLKEGDTLRCYVPFLGGLGKIHIMYILDGYYNGEKLYVYRVFGKHKRWWHQYMVKTDDLKMMIHQTKKFI